MAFDDPEMPDGGVQRIVASMEADILASQQQLAAQQQADQARRRVAPAGNLTAPYDPDRFIPDYGWRMADVPLSNDMPAAPLDLSSFGGTPPFVPQQGQSPAGGIFGGIDWKNAKNLAPLAMLMPIVAKTGGRGAVAALLRGHQQGQARRDQQARLASQDQREAARDERADASQRSLDDYRKAQIDQDKLARQQQLRSQFAAGLPNIDNDEAARAYAAFFYPQADAIGISRQELDSMLLQSVKPSTLQRKSAEARINELQKDHKDRWFEEGQSWSYDLGDKNEDGTPRLVPFEEVLRRSGRQRNPNAPAPVPQRDGSLTEFENYFQGEFLPAVNEERRAQGNNKPLTRTELRDLKLQARAGWTTSGRAPSDRSDDSGIQRDRDVTFIRQRIREALVSGKGVSAVARKYRGKLEGYGADFDAVVAMERRALRRQDISDAGARQRFIENGGDESSLDAAFDEALDTGGAPAPGATPAPARPAAQPRAATKADVERVAKAQRVTYAEAKKQLESRGVMVRE